MAIELQAAVHRVRQAKRKAPYQREQAHDATGLLVVQLEPSFSFAFESYSQAPNAPKTASGSNFTRGHGANRGRATRDYDTTPTSIEVGIVVGLMKRVEPMIPARYSRVTRQPRSLKTVARGLPNTP